MDFSVKERECAIPSEKSGNLPGIPFSTVKFGV